MELLEISVQNHCTMELLTETAMKMLSRAQGALPPTHTWADSKLVHSDGVA